MKSGVAVAFTLVAVLLGAITGSAHHPISAKFDDTKPQTLSGVVTLVDWRNPHVHIYMNVRNNNDADNWAIELESPIDLQASGWTRESVSRRRDHGRGHRGPQRQPAAVGHQGHDAGTGKEVLRVTPRRRRRSWPTGPRRAGPTGSPGLARAGRCEGYWAFPSSTVLVENAADIPMDQ